MNSCIKGIGVYLPEKSLSSEEVENIVGYEKYGLRNGIVKMITGVEKRHYASQYENSSDIAAKCSINAISNAKMEIKDIDAILFCSVTQDFAEPATSNVIAEKLGAENIFCLDVKNGCNAFFNGMDIADSLIRTGKAKNILIVSGEVLSRWVKFKYDNKKDLIEGSPVTLSLGDGGGAFVISPTNEKKGILSTYFKTYPKLWNNIVTWGGGTVYPHNPNKMFISGINKPLVDVHIKAAKDSLEKILNKVCWNKEEVNFFIISQISKWIADTLIKELGIPIQKTNSVFKKWGNVASSNVALATYDAFQNNKIKNGSKVVFIGGAVGFSSCALAVEF